MPDPLSLIRCPSCRKQSLRPHLGQPGRLACPGCGAGYDCPRGTPDLVSTAGPRPGLAQRFMESRPVAAVYESRLWRRSLFWRSWARVGFEAECRLIMDAAGVGPATDILDVACGTGLYTRRFARAAAQGRVLGVDVSRPMLERATRLARKRRLCSAAFVRASALDLPCFDASVDAVNCCGALYLFEDPGRAVAEFARVIKPGGILTTATIRVADSALASAAPRLGMALFGVGPAGREEHAVRLATAGFVDLTWHHDKGFWQVVSARKSG